MDDIFKGNKVLGPCEGNCYRYSGHEMKMIELVTVDLEYGSQKKLGLPLIIKIVAGDQRPPLSGCDWIHSIKQVGLSYTKGSSADIIKKF